jgi:hypothetical protein
MMTSIALALVLSCKRPNPMPPVDEFVSRPAIITACEGADRVTRNLNGVELNRSINSCTVVRCEGWDLVRRDHSGVEFERRVSRCMPRPDPRPQPKPEQQVLKFGLSAR